MKLTSFSSDTLTRNPALKTFLIYGTDEGMIDERVLEIRKAVVPSSDPLCFSSFQGSAVSNDPSVLYDEALSLSFLGGTKVILVSGIGNDFAATLKDFLDSYDGEHIVIFTADSLNQSSPLKKLCDANPKVGVYSCYPDTAETLSSYIHSFLRERGVTIDLDALDFLTGNLGSDRKITRTELEKLLLFIGIEKNITFKDVSACTSNSSALSNDLLTSLVSDGNALEASRLYDRLIAEGQTEIAVLRILSSHFGRLFVTSSRIADGIPADKAILMLPMPPRYKQADVFRRQLQKWPAGKAAKALEILETAEKLCKTTGIPQTAVAGRALLHLCLTAK